MLDGAVDPEQLGVAAGDAEHVRPAGDLDLEVVVGDAAAEHLDPCLLAGPDARDDRLDIHRSDPLTFGAAAERSPTRPLSCFCIELSDADRSHRSLGADRQRAHRRPRGRRSRPRPARPARPDRRRTKLGGTSQAGTIDEAALQESARSCTLPARTSASAGPTRRRKRCSTRASTGTRLIAETAARLPGGPVLVCASAVGLLRRSAATRCVDESSPSADSGFLAEVVEAWEAAAEPAREAGLRTVHLRQGHRPLAAAAARCSGCCLPFKLGAGGRIGSGRPVVELGLARRRRRRLPLRARAARSRALST